MYTYRAVCMQLSINLQLFKVIQWIYSSVDSYLEKPTVLDMYILFQELVNTTNTSIGMLDSHKMVGNFMSINRWS